MITRDGASFILEQDLAIDGVWVPIAKLGWGRRWSRAEIARRVRKQNELF